MTNNNSNSLLDSSTLAKKIAHTKSSFDKHQQYTDGGLSQLKMISETEEMSLSQTVGNALTRFIDNLQQDTNNNNNRGNDDDFGYL